MICQQLDLFDGNDIDVLKRENRELRYSLDRLRKAMWARQNEMAKILADVCIRQELIEKNICSSRD